MQLIKLQTMKYTCTALFCCCWHISQHEIYADADLSVISAYYNGQFQFYQNPIKFNIEYFAIEADVFASVCGT